MAFAPTVVLLLGPPASGKSTLGDRLARHFGGRHLDLGAILRQGEGKGRTVDALLADELAKETAVATHKVAAGQGQHFVFVNGFPRKLDGLSFWEGATVNKPALALVLEAPDDVLTARVEERGRGDDHEEKIIDRLAFYRQHTQPVVASINEAGIARYLDAACEANLLFAAAVHVLQPSLVFLTGKTDLLKVLGQRLSEELGPASTQVDYQALRQDCPGPVTEILGRRLKEPDAAGRLVVVHGFPERQTSHDLEEWLSREGLPQPILLLQLGPGSTEDLPSEGLLLRHFEEIDEKSSARMVQLIRSCQPLSLAAPYAALSLLHRWMAVAPHLQWWDPNLFRKIEGHYVSYMKSQSQKHRREAGTYTRPSESPSMEVWVLWLSHLLESERYMDYCGNVLQKTIGPLPPPKSMGLTKSFPGGGAGASTAAASSKKPRLPLCGLMGSESAEAKLLPSRESPARIPVAFTDLLASLHDAGLEPLSDPRQLWSTVCIPKGTSGSDRIGERLMRLLGLHYRRFLVVLGEAGPSGQVGPPAALDWIWHAHVAHPGLYAHDCCQLFGHVVPHKPAEAPDRLDGEAASLGQLLRQDLQALADDHIAELQEDSQKFSMEEDVKTLACFIRSGDKKFLAEVVKDAGDLASAVAAVPKSKQIRWDPAKKRYELAKGVAGHDDAEVLAVTVRLLSGAVVLEKKMRRDARVSNVVELLREQGGSDDILKFFVDGVQLEETTLLRQTGVAKGSVVTLIRVQRPPPVVTRSYSPDTTRCTCFTESCIFHVRTEGGQLHAKSMRNLWEGDMVHTGAASLKQRFRRVTRIWECSAGPTETVQLQKGCRLTTGHPLQAAGRWTRPEALGLVETTFEKAVYTIELEGHVDTVLVGHDVETAVVCAALGVYCGKDFGWNIFTRKTRFCDSQPCEKCRVAVRPRLNFAQVTCDMLAKQYPPY